MMKMSIKDLTKKAVITGVAALITAACGETIVKAPFDGHEPGTTYPQCGFPVRQESVQPDGVIIAKELWVNTADAYEVKYRGRLGNEWGSPLYEKPVLVEENHEYCPNNKL